MFIVSKRNFKIHLADGTAYRIAKDFMGDIPGHIAEHPLVKAAIADGTIVTPAGHKDREIEAAAAVAAAVEAGNDIRPDAPKKKARKKAQ